MQPKTHDIIIAGAGLSGLCAAHFLKKQNPNVDVILIDKANRPGGAIETYKENGFIAEYGAHGWLDNSDETKELLSDLDIESEIQKADLKKFIRYLCLDAKLKPVPQSPLKIIKSDIMPLKHKLRILADIIKSPKQGEQTVADWASHRFGKGILPFADAVFTGTYAGDINKLSIDATMPGVRHLEQQAGSVIRGAFKLKKQKKGVPLPSMISFKNGMKQLITSLVENKTIIYNTPVIGLRRLKNCWQILTPKEDINTHQIMIALHINRALPVLKTLTTPPVYSIPEAKLANVVMGFDQTANIPFGFGYLAPEKEKRFAMGTLFSSHMFKGRAPKDHSLLEVLIGGRRHPERLEMDDQDIINRSYQDIKELIDLPNPPLYSKVLRPKIGIPQLEMNHLQIQEWRNWLEKENKGLKVIGFGWDGIGINDMIKQAKNAAHAMSETQDGLTNTPEAKAVYF